MKTEEIVGHQKVLGLLSAVISKDSVAHAYLFVGTAQVGKGAVAKWFASQLVDTKKAPQNLIIVRPDKSIKIKDVRALQHELSLTNPYGGWRAVILGDLDQMTIAAQNAFLKILEEPQTKVIFILLARRLRAVLPTIISRTQLVRLAVVRQAEIAADLQKHGVEENRARELARLSRGRPGWARNCIADKDIESEVEKPAADFLKTFSASIFERCQYAKEISDSESSWHCLEAWEGVLRDCLLYQQGQGDDLVYLSLRSEIEKIAKSVSPKSIQQALRGLVAVKKQLEKNANSKLVFENYFINHVPLKEKI